MDRYRYLAFAFATADLLFEIDDNGVVVFAVGSAHGLVQNTESEIIGCFWRELICESDHDMVEAMFAGLEGLRCGPVTVQLKTSEGEPRYAALSACRLPPRTEISCAFAFPGAAPLSARTACDRHGFQDKTQFVEVAETVLTAAATVGQELDLALIEMPGLGGRLESMDPIDAAALLKRFAGALRAEAYAGAPATRLSEERFAVVRPKGRSPERIQHRLNRAVAEVEGAQGLDATAHVMAIESAAEGVERSLKALRYAIDQFTLSGAAVEPGADFQAALNQSIKRTLSEASEFRATVQARRFALAFQPIVSLKTGECEHFETLVRFHGDTSPYKLIRMAEELDLILDLDLAIAEQVLGRLAASSDPKLCLAVNVSGRSIMDPRFVAAIKRMAGPHGAMARRLMFEVTESAEIDDLEVADRHIQELRSDGHKVCLDDFGAGAASYAYLQKLHVDVVKIDGRYVKELAEQGRDSKLVRHLVNLCRDLGVSTIAEMVSNLPVEDAARAAGVDYGQGFHYGQPGAEPVYHRPAPTAPIARRKGVIEQWG